MKHAFRILVLAFAGSLAAQSQTLTGSIFPTISTYADDTAANAACTGGTCPIGKIYRRESDDTLRYVATSAGTFVGLAPAASPVFTGIVTLPSDSAPTTDADGECAFDADAWASGRDALECFDGTASTYLIGALVSDTPSNGQVPKWNTGGTITWEDDDSGAGGGITSLGGQTGATQTITRGAGIGGTSSGDDHSFATASGEEGFLAAGALTCGASTSGKMQVHTTALQYCDNAGTPTLQYAAYADSSGRPTVAVDETYDATGWNGDTAPPEKDDVRDKFEALAPSGIVAAANLPATPHSFTVAAPVATDDFNLMKAPAAMTMLTINCIVQGTTSVTGQIQECGTDGSSCADLDSDITCDADGAADDGSLTDSSIASGAWLRWKTTSVSGTPTFLTVTFTRR